MIITSEYVYNNFKLDETRNIVGKTLEEHERKYVFNYKTVIKGKCIADFLDKIKNEMKKITVDCYNIIGELNKIMQKSKGEIKLIRVIQVKIIREGEIYIIIMDICLKSACMPILYRNFYVKVVKHRDILYNRPQNCCEKHYCHFNER